MATYSPFNGGKMMHIFTISNNLYTPNFYSNEAKEALENGRFFVKIDGSNALLKKVDGVWYLYSRYDDGKRKINRDVLPSNTILLPEGKNIDQYNSGNKEHAYFYQLRSRPLPEDKGKLAKINRNLYRIVDEEMKGFLEELKEDYITVELVGQKFNATPGVMAQCGIAPHSSQTIDVEKQFRTFIGMKDYLLNQKCIEGLVIEWKGVYWKIRSNCFDKRCNFECVKKNNKEWTDDMLPILVFL